MVPTDARRPVVHQPTPAVEQVHAPMGRLDGGGDCEAIQPSPHRQGASASLRALRASGFSFQALQFRACVGVLSIDLPPFPTETVSPEVERRIAGCHTASGSGMR